MTLIRGAKPVVVGGGPTGLTAPVQRADLADDVVSRLVASRRFAEHRADVGATSRTSTGLTGFTPTGTITSADDSDGVWHNYATPAASIGSNANHYSHLQFRRNWLAEWHARIKVVDTTDLRLMLGLTSGALSDAGMTNAHLAIFRYATPEGDANWKCLTNDSGGAGGTVADSGVAVTARVYELAVRTLASSVQFWIDGVLVHTATATLPAGAPSMGPILTLYTRAAAVKNVKWSRQNLLQV